MINPTMPMPPAAGAALMPSNLMASAMMPQQPQRPMMPMPPKLPRTAEAMRLLGAGQPYPQPSLPTLGSY